MISDLNWSYWLRANITFKSRRLTILFEVLIAFSLQYVMYIPGLTILLKIPLVLPGVSCYLDKIRGGWERNGGTGKVNPAKPLHEEKPEQPKDSYAINFPPQYTSKQSNGRMINVRST